MNVYGMQKIKDFARSIGYVVEENGWQNKKKCLLSVIH